MFRPTIPRISTSDSSLIAVGGAGGTGYLPLPSPSAFFSIQDFNPVLPSFDVKGPMSAGITSGGAHWKDTEPFANGNGNENAFHASDVSSYSPSSSFQQSSHNEGLSDGYGSTRESSPSSSLDLGPSTPEPVILALDYIGGAHGPWEKVENTQLESFDFNPSLDLIDMPYPAAIPTDYSNTAHQIQPDGGRDEYYLPLPLYQPAQQNQHAFAGQNSGGGAMPMESYERSVVGGASAVGGQHHHSLSLPNSNYPNQTYPHYHFQTPVHPLPPMAQEQAQYPQQLGHNFVYPAAPSGLQQLERRDSPLNSFETAQGTFYFIPNPSESLSPAPTNVQYNQQGQYPLPSQSYAQVGSMSNSTSHSNSPAFGGANLEQVVPQAPALNLALPQHTNHAYSHQDQSFSHLPIQAPLPQHHQRTTSLASIASVGSISWDGSEYELSGPTASLLDDQDEEDFKPKRAKKSSPTTSKNKKAKKAKSASAEEAAGGAGKRFYCPQRDCGRAFARNFNMQSHLKSHLGIREFDCPHCNKKFSRRHDRARHCTAVHNSTTSSTMSEMGDEDDERDG